MLTVHGATQGESSDAVSIHTASTSVSGNGNHITFVSDAMFVKKVQINSKAIGASESSSSRMSAITVVLPWGAQKETVKLQQIGDMDLRPGEFVMRTLFAEFTSQAEKKMEAVMTEHVSGIFVRALLVSNREYIVGETAFESFAKRRRLAV